MTEFAVIEKLDELHKLIINGRAHDKWVNLQDVSAYSSLSESTIRRAVRTGALKASHATGKLLFKISDIDKWLNG